MTNASKRFLVSAMALGLAAVSSTANADPDPSTHAGRAAVYEIVAVDGGDDDVAQTKRANRVRNALGLAWVNRARTAVCHRAVRARPRADVAEDHERCGPVVPAFADVGAASLLTYRVET